MIEPLSQRDARWKDIPLGDSNKTIGTHGCLITCIAMLAGLTPDDVNERLKKNKGYKDTNLVVWDRIDESIPWLRCERRVTTYNNDDVKNNIPCLVEVNGSRIGADKHWVLYIGNQQMNDPWYGNTKTTSYYPPTGYAVIKVIGEKEEDMPKWFETLLQQSNLSLDDEGGFRNFWQKAIEYDDKIKDLTEQIKSANETLADKSLEVSGLIGKVTDLGNKVSELEERFNSVKNERDDFKWQKEKLEIKVKTLEEDITTRDKDIEALRIDLATLQAQSVEGIKTRNLIKIILRRLLWWKE